MSILRFGIRCALVSLLAVCAASSAFAQAVGLDELLQASRTATGATESTLDLVIVGDADCAGPNGEFETRTSSAPQGNFWFRQKYPGQAAYAALLTQEGGWFLRKDGSREELGPRVWLMVRSHDFQRIALDPGSFARDLSPSGQEEFQGTECYKLQGVIGDGSGFSFFFAQDTGLPRGFRMENPLDPGRPVNIVYREWRQVSGVMLPCLVAALDGQGEFVLNFHTLYFEEVIPPEEPAEGSPEE